MPERHIVAMGGGGFLMEPSPLLDDYVLALCGKAEPNVCFLATASGDAAATSRPSTARSLPAAPGPPI